MSSLYFRVFLITVYTIAISCLLGLFMANAYYHWELKHRQDAKLFGAAQNMQAYISQVPEKIDDFLRITAGLGYQIYMYDEEGNETFYGNDFGIRDLPAGVKEAVLAGSDYHGIADYPYHALIPSYFDNRQSNTVGVAVTAGPERYAMFLRHDSRLQFDELQLFFALMFGFSVLFGIPYLLVSTRYLVQPIIRLTEATKRVAQGDFNLKLPTKRRDEIGQLASHFRKMAFQLESSDKAKREFVANVSHEIQSPLASIQGYADSLLRKDIGEEQIRRYATVIGQEARQLAALSRQLLLLSTLDNGTEAVSRRSYPLRPQIRQALQLLEWQLAEKEIAVYMRVPSQLYMNGDEVLLMQVWSNLLSNAVKYIPEGRTIEIKAFREQGSVIVSVADTGEGIAADELPFIFDRFYRTDKARKRGEGSTGLGLSIVQRIVHLHGGSVEAESEVGSGTVFRVRIPDQAF
ncbi:sensor histidine kinase [Paenibacillus thailandensis]|uniref:Heme sensor protein HssS n=1 Tax=Paenibacillus thailandensis TaxID=393250 RepID=A0ABW5QW99_9BACL